MTVEEWGDVKEWTEENVLTQLKQDVEFGWEKAQGGRGISSDFMFCCVEMWNAILENGIETGYGEYGKPLFQATAEHYGWDLPT